MHGMAIFRDIWLHEERLAARGVAWGTTIFCIQDICIDEITLHLALLYVGKFDDNCCMCWIL